MDEIPLSEGVQSIIGRYRLLEKIGEGGFGVVYVAEQKTPVRRRVALKIIKLGMDTRSVLALWETQSWQELLTLEGERATFLSTAFSPSGDSIGSLNRTGTLTSGARRPGRKSTRRRQTRRRR